jgi:hypothetical protein
MKTKITLFCILFSLLSGGVFAKKVKFAVDMGTYTINPTGIHVLGDFQVAAGYSLNFDPGSTQMTQVGASTIYTVIVTIPAFQKYEFKFVNGDQGYEVEFVPEQCRVGYNFNDNRWIYVDSLQNDTTYLGAVKFGENAPQGKTFMRYMVDMQNAGAISPNGVHFGSTFQGMNPLTHRMYSFISGVYEGYGYMTTGVQQFRFYNGNTVGTAETVPNNCATGGNRTFSLTQDTIMSTVCFSSCNACIPTGIKQLTSENKMLVLYPNPATGVVNLMNIKGTEKIVVVDISGKVCDMKELKDSQSDSFQMDISNLKKGVYNVYLQNGKQYYQSRLIVQ